MTGNYEINVKGLCTYDIYEANSKEEAIAKAIDYFCDDDMFYGTDVTENVTEKDCEVMSFKPIEFEKEDTPKSFNIDLDDKANKVVDLLKLIVLENHDIRTTPIEWFDNEAGIHNLELTKDLLEEVQIMVEFIPKEMLFPNHTFEVEEKNDKDVDSNVETIRVLYIKPGMLPQVIDIEDTLEAKQELVGGYIELCTPFEDDVAIICNEEGKLIGMEPNRGLYNDEGKLYDVIYGPFFLAYAPIESERFLSLSQDQIEKYGNLFFFPEKFKIKQDVELEK